MEEKQIAEIDARIAPILRAVDAYCDFVAPAGVATRLDARREAIRVVFVLARIAPRLRTLPVDAGAARRPFAARPRDAASSHAVEVEAERSIMRPYPARGRRREMGWYDHHRAIGKGMEEALPCRARHFRVDAKTAVQLGFSALQRRMHDITAENR